MNTHCCEDMRREAERVCGQHPERFDCPDCLVRYEPRFREYGLIIHDGGTSVAAIRFCPWCGIEFLPSLRERWFEELETLGIDPTGQEVPEQYRTDAWHRTERRNYPPPHPPNKG